MKQDRDKFEYYYTYENDESLRGHTDNQGIIEFLTTEKYMRKTIPPHSKILDACAGCGVYSFLLADLGHSVIAGDYTQHHVDQMIKKQTQNPILQDIYCGSATDLSQFDDESFDVVLNMGAFYHITDKNEREKTIIECLRVLKPNGLLFLAYLNKFSNIVKYHSTWHNRFEVVEKIVERGYSDDDSLFYTSIPEEVEEVLEGYGVTILHNIATDGFKATVADTINKMDNELFERYLNYHFKTCEIKSLLGYSEHALAICIK